MEKLSQDILNRMLVAGLESDEYEVADIAWKNGADPNFRNGRALRRFLSKHINRNYSLNEWSLSWVLKLLIRIDTSTLTAKNSIGETIIDLMKGRQALGHDSYKNLGYPIVPQYLIKNLEDRVKHAII